MSNTLDVSAVKDACFADLSRLRQDDLPLSHKEGKAPSFAPVRDNSRSAAAVLEECKQKVQNKWNTFISDEESEQIQGLSNDDARPWAKKITDAYAAKNPYISAPPQVGASQAKSKKAKSHGPKPLNNNQTASSSSGGPAPSSRPSQERLGVAATNVPKKTPARIGSAQSMLANNPAPEATNNVKNPAAGTKTASDLALQVAPAHLDRHDLHMDTHPVNIPGSSEFILCQGTCAVRLPPASADVKTPFVLKVDMEANCALLLLAPPGEPQRVLRLVDLKEPGLQDGYCHLASIPGKGNVACRLKLQTSDLTRKFKLYLDNLQEAAKRQFTVGTTPSAANAQPETVGPGFAAKGPTEFVGAPRALSSELEENSDYSGTIGSEAALRPQSVAKGKGLAPPEATGRLVDIDDGDSADLATHAVMSIEGAAERLLSFMHALEADVMGQGFPLTDTRLDELEGAAIDMWLNRGFLKDMSDDIKDEAINLLKDLYRIKRRAFQIRLRIQNRQKSEKAPAPMASPSSLEYLRDLRLGSPPARLQYTPEQISGLAHKATPRPAALDDASYLPPPDFKRLKMSTISPLPANTEPPAGSQVDSPHPAVAQSDLMELDPIPSATLPRPAPLGGLSSSRFAPANRAPTAAATTTKPRPAAAEAKATGSEKSGESRAKPALQGLKSSRWAK